MEKRVAIWDARRKRERSRNANAISAHAQTGRDTFAARTIPAKKDIEIHNKGMEWILQQNKT